MKSSSRSAARQGFTLIELIIVIAILGMVAIIGIRSFANLRDIQAKKVNLANIKNAAHALETYQVVCKETNAEKFFDGFDALIDGGSGSAVWTGSAGTFRWTGNNVSGGPGIYSGSWKNLLPLTNASGQGGSTPTLDSALENLATRGPGLMPEPGAESGDFGIYFLSTNDVALLKDAGITYTLLHNASTAQSASYASVTNADPFVVNGGGPGFRPDMSACYPMVLEAGSPVLVVNPLTTGKNGKKSCNSIYKDLGYAKTVDESSTSDSLLSGQTDKLVCFGIGKSAKCVTSAVGLGEAPVNPSYNVHNYRYYLAVFVISTRGQGTASSCRFAGVLDCAGQTYRAAEYALNWSTELN